MLFFDYLYIFKKIYTIPKNYILFDGYNTNNTNNINFNTGQNNHCEINFKNKITENNKKYLELYNKYILGLLPLFESIEY